MMPNQDQHPQEWLGAYLDGELSGVRLEQITTHLTGCAACRQELDELRKLSTLLQEAPAFQPQISGEQAAQRVKLLLPREIGEPRWQGALRIGWNAVPAVFLAGWAFFQAVLLVAGIWSSFGGNLQLPIDLGTPSTLFVPLPWSLSLLGAFGEQFLRLPFDLPELPAWLGVLLQGTVISMVISALTFFLLAGWAASRWAIYRHEQTLRVEKVDL